MNQEKPLYTLIPIDDFMALLKHLKQRHQEGNLHGSVEYTMPQGNGGIVETEFYRIIPDCGSNEDFPYSIEFSPAVARMGCKALGAVYLAGLKMKN